MSTINAEFFSDHFNATTLTESINGLPLKPMRLAAMGLFRESGLYTTDLEIERIHNRLALVPSSPRGAPGAIHQRATRDMVKANTAHFTSRDTIYADSLQNRREYGGNTLMTVQAETNRVLQGMRDNHETTLEHQRIASLKGLVQDVNGNVLIDLYAAFEVTQQTTDMALDVDGTRMRARCLTFKRQIEDELGGVAYQGVHVLCSSGFFDAFTEHPAVLEAFNRYADGQFLRDDVRKGLQFADCTFEEYRGGVDGTDFLADGEAYAFPLGLPDLFVTKFAPADFLETVNTQGLPHYAKAAMEPMGRYVSIEGQSNPLSLCTRPRAVIKLTA